MSDALKAAVLDLKTLRPYLKMIPLLLVLGVVMETSMNAAGFVTIYAATIIITLAAYPFGAEEKSRLHLLQLSLPVSRRALVAGRYMQVTAVAAVMAVISFALSFVASLISGKPFVLSGTLMTALIGCASALFIVTLQYPFYYRMGFLKARYIVNIPIFLVFLLAPQIKLFKGSALASRLVLWLRAVSAHPSFAVIAVLLFVALAAYLSFLISYRFFKYKDM